MGKKLYLVGIVVCIAIVFATVYIATKITNNPYAIVLLVGGVGFSLVSLINVWNTIVDRIEKIESQNRDKNDGR